MGTLRGYAGKLLRVDLSAGRATEEAVDEKTCREYLGGTGLGAKYLFEEVPADAAWSDERNRLIICSGPLGGTAVGGSGTVSVVTKGALSEGAACSQANGFFGAFLRFAGYDGIIVQGKARGWVYLYIHDGKAELKDASHLVGKDTYETGDLVKAELGQNDRTMSVASIGPAGENLIRFASILVDKGHCAAHNGVGAVMGSKKLKAIAVARSQQRLEFADKQGLSALGKQAHENVLSDPGGLSQYKWGTLSNIVRSVTAKDGVVPVKNYRTSIYDIEPEKLEEFSPTYIRGHFDPKPQPCWGCQMHHCHMLTITEGKYSGMTLEEPEYEQFASWGPVIGVTDVTSAMMLSREADCLGVDSNEGGWLFGMVMECYEKGILSQKDCDGLEMNWGNAESTKEMLRRISRREGIGDILAEGVMRAARRIGKEAPNFAIHSMKGNTPRTHDHRTKWPTMFDTCLSQIGTDEGFSMSRPADLGLSIKPNMKTNNSSEDSVNWNAQCKGATPFEDSLGVCRFTTKTDLKLLSQAVSAATGWDFSAEEAFRVGKRIVNLLRVFNLRHGHTAEMDAPSPRYGSTPVDGVSQGKSIMPYRDEMRRKYYELMGWDRETGVPLPETLRSVGLE
ncbi:MAG: hypothetical protein HYY32_04355, partial [Chloroflexi bacterium]|nr:hypothetical protein [Chloroflexota bacterium]